MGQVSKTERKRYYLIFKSHNLPSGNWYQNLLRWSLNRLKSGFSHVMIIQQVAPEQFIIVDGCSDCLSVNCFYEIGFINKLFNDPEITVVEVLPENSGVRPRGLITCVSVAKYVLGINKPSIITPYQLYQYVTKKGL